MTHSSPGKYQVLTAFLLCCIQLPITFSDHLLAIYGRAPPHRCKLASNATAPALGPSLTRPLVEERGRKIFSPCTVYTEPFDHAAGIQPCTRGWEYLHLDEEWTIITEWDLVCHREYLLNLLPYAYVVGNMLGGLMFGVFADRYGRRLCLLVALLFHTLLGISLHFFSLFVVFAVGYALQGFFVTAIQCLSVTLLLETVSFPYHLKTTFCLCFISPMGVICFSLLSWLIKNWRYIQLAISSPGIVCLGYFWLLPKSVPWLLSVSNVADAEKQMLRFARFNKTQLPVNVRQHLADYCKMLKSVSTRHQHNLESVMCSPNIRRYTFILYYIWFVIALESEASSAELPALKDNKYASLFVKGVMDLGMLILLYFTAQRFGARFAHATFLIIGGCQCVGSAFLGYSELHGEVSEMLALVSPVLALMGKTSIKSVVATNIFFSSKVFPTGVRAVGLGSCLFWTRTAQLIGVHLSSLDVADTHYFPLAGYGALSVIGGCLTSFLPSDCCRPLPNAAIEVEKSVILGNAYRNKKQHRPRTPHPTMCEVDDDEETDVDDNENNNNNNTLLELSVHEFPATILRKDACRRNNVDGAGPSTQSLGCASAIDKADTESRLTDLEEELSKIWELNTVPGGSSEFRHDDVKEHYVNMHETRF